MALFAGAQDESNESADKENRSSSSNLGQTNKKPLVIRSDSSPMTSSKKRRLKEISLCEQGRNKILSEEQEREQFSQ